MARGFLAKGEKQEQICKLNVRAAYQIPIYNPLFVSTRRDVPPERLYKIEKVVEKGVLNPDFV
jgi:hypothetical protein